MLVVLRFHGSCRLQLLMPRRHDTRLPTVPPLLPVFSVTVPVPVPDPSVVCHMPYASLIVSGSVHHNGLVVCMLELYLYVVFERCSLLREEYEYTWIS